MKAPKGKGKKPSGGKQDRGFERTRHDAPRPESKLESRFEGKSDKGSSFKKPRPQFAKAAPRPADDKPTAPLREIKPYAGARPAEKLPLILETEPSPDYALLDSGNGLKLEQYGPYRIVRPEGQAIWLPNLPQKEWDQADAVFTG
ncbi:MAG: class I SAM-dependent rRNA methyltransferase, partial [Brucella intermedia]